MRNTPSQKPQSNPLYRNMLVAALALGGACHPNEKTGTPRPQQSEATDISSLSSAEIEEARRTGAINLREEVASLDGLEGVPLESFRMEFNDHITDLGALGSMQTLKGVSLVSYENPELSPLGQIEGLERLGLVFSQTENLKALQDLTSMRELALSKSAVRDISAVQGMRNLRFLELYQVPVNDISPVSGLPNLREFSSYNAPIADVSPLASLGNLEKVDMTSYCLNDLSPLAEASNLKSLDIFPGSVSQNDLSALGNLDLETLKIAVTKDPKESAAVCADPAISNLMPPEHKYHAANGREGVAKLLEELSHDPTVLD